MIDGRALRRENKVEGLVTHKSGDENHQAFYGSKKKDFRVTNAKGRKRRRRRPEDDIDQTTKLVHADSINQLCPPFPEMMSIPD